MSTSIFILTICTAVLAVQLALLASVMFDPNNGED